ncbi:hypothetical protein ACHWQZ_G015142 [Mnemiopsis leidyi]
MNFPRVEMLLKARECIVVFVRLLAVKHLITASISSLLLRILGAWSEGTSSPVSVSVGKLKKIQKLSESINVFRTTLTHGALARLIRDD